MAEEKTWLGFDETPLEDKMEQLRTLLQSNFISQSEYDERVAVITGNPVVTTKSNPVVSVGRDTRLLEIGAAVQASQPSSSTIPQAVDHHVDPWDSERRGSFFIEWRVTQPDIKAKFAQLQQRLKLVGGKSVQILQSAAADNMHITMNEFRLGGDAELQRLKRLLKEKFTMPPHEAIAIQGVGNFNKRVLFANIHGDALKNCFSQLQSLLKKEGFNPRDRGEFKPHMTLCKLHPKSQKFPDQVFTLIESLPGSTISFGDQPLRQLVLCVKRKKEEIVPPILQIL